MKRTATTLFGLSTMTAVLASLVGVQTLVFPTGAGAGLNQYCFPTPRTFAPSPCGCPAGIGIQVYDFCENVVPAPPTT